MFRVSAIACSSATDFLFSSAISTCVLLHATAGETPRRGRERRAVENGIWKFEGVRKSHLRLPRSPSQERLMNLTDFLAASRTVSLPDRELLDAPLHPMHRHACSAL